MFASSYAKSSRTKVLLTGQQNSLSYRNELLIAACVDCAVWQAAVQNGQSRVRRQFPPQCGIVLSMNMH